jgi:hypothetical protein
VTRDFVKASGVLGAQIPCITRSDLFLEDIEGALCVWFKD